MKLKDFHSKHDIEYDSIIIIMAFNRDQLVDIREKSNSIAPLGLNSRCTARFKNSERWRLYQFDITSSTCPRSVDGFRKGR